MKVGRNDPCPCGSGKKYKKCCTPKYDAPAATPVQTRAWAPKGDGRFEDFGSFASRAWTPEKLAGMSDNEIVDKLNALGIRTDQQTFAREAEGQVDVEQIVDKWMGRLPLDADILDEDFPLLAAMELWNRWLPDRLSLHRLEDMLEDYLDNNPGERDLERIGAIWTALKENFLLPNRMRSFHQFMDRFKFPYDMNAVFFELHTDMVKDCKEKQDADPEIWNRLILLYEDVRDTLTELTGEDRWDLLRVLAEAHFHKGDAATAEELFRLLTSESPEWVWGYVGWGDLYNPVFNGASPSANQDEALRLYRLGLEHASSGKDILERRIKGIMIG
jgi:hypothetical protein